MVTRTAPVAFLVLALAACAHQQLAPTSDTRLSQREAAFFAAVAARDADAVAELFAETAVVHVASMPQIEGREAIRGFYRNMFGFLALSRATPGARHVSAGGDMAYSTGRAINEFRGPQGSVEYAGKYVLVWRRIAGDWMIVFYGVSSDQPAGER